MELEPSPDAPLISVIITNYNYSHYLGHSVSSVLSQDFPSFELVVVDNASTDNTDEVMATFAHDPKLRFIKNERNLGLTPNHNNGLRQSRGQYILFLSADDALLPGHLRRCYDYLQAHPKTDVFYTGVIFIDANGTPYAVRAMGGQLPVDYDGGRNEFAGQLAEGCYIPYPAMLIRRSLYDELGPMDESFIGADYEITMRWAAAGKRFAYTRVPSCAIRIHGPQASGMTYVESGSDVLEYLAIVEKYATAENQGRFAAHRQSIVQHIKWRADFYRQSKGADAAPEIFERANAVIAHLESINLEPRHVVAANSPVMSVIVRVGSLSQLLRSLGSLAAQEDGVPWEAVVVGEGGADYGPLLASMPYRDNVQFVRLDERAPATARNTGIRLTSGPIITYMEPGTMFAPNHLGNIVHAMQSGPVVVRTNAHMKLGESRNGHADTLFRETPIAGIILGEQDDERELTAPVVPIETIAHLRVALEYTGAFRADLPYGDVWEFWMRMRQQNAVYLPWETVETRCLLQHLMPDAGTFLAIARGLYGAYPAPAGSTLAVRRQNYLNALAPYFERGPTTLHDAQTGAQFLATFSGLTHTPIAVGV